MQVAVALLWYKMFERGLPPPLRESEPLLGSDGDLYRTGSQKAITASYGRNESADFARCHES